MKLSARLTRAGLTFIILGCTAAILQEDGRTMADVSQCPTPGPLYELDGRYSNGSFTHDGLTCGTNGTHDVVRVGITHDVSGENHRLVSPTDVQNPVFMISSTQYLSLSVDPGGVTATITRNSVPLPNKTTSVVFVTVTSKIGGTTYTLTNTLTVTK